MRIRLLSNNRFLLHGVFFIILLIGFILGACKKEKVIFSSNQDEQLTRLTGDTAIMVGTWHWIYSELEYGWCDNEQWYETLTPSTENTDIQVAFLDEGLVRFYKDSKLYGEHRIVFRDFTSNSSTCFDTLGCRFFIYLDNNENEYLSACMLEDTMQMAFSGFIFRTVPGCEGYTNYFLRQ